MKKVTIRDIAEEAGVSLSTVSLVINNKGSVSNATRDKILELMRKYNYQTVSAGKHKPFNRNNTIGLLVSNRHFFLDEQYYINIYLSALIEAGKNDINLKIYIINEEQVRQNKIPECIGSILGDDIHGVIIMGDIPDEHFHAISHLRIPFVTINYYSPDWKDVVAIIPDDINGAYQAISHLIALGHKKIAFLGPMSHHPTIKDRLEGYKMVHKEQNIPITEKNIYMDPVSDPYQYGYACGKRIIYEKKDITAVFGSVDMTALGCIKAFQEENIEIPRNISVIGYDDIILASYINPTLTTIRSNRARLGELAVQKIVSMHENRERYSDKIIVPVKLIIRDSCGGLKK